MRLASSPELAGSAPPFWTLSLHRLHCLDILFCTYISSPSLIFYPDKVLTGDIFLPLLSLNFCFNVGGWRVYSF